LIFVVWPTHIRIVCRLCLHMLGVTRFFYDKSFACGAVTSSARWC
jgi:hypothetical protein